MKARMILFRFLALLLALCLLPTAALAGVADTNALAYEKALQMLTTSSLTDGEKLALVREQFEQAGSYQFGVDYLTLTDALMILQSGNVNRFDEALESVRNRAVGAATAASRKLIVEKHGADADRVLAEKVIAGL